MYFSKRIGDKSHGSNDENVSEYPHTFTSKLKGQNVVEHDRWTGLEFEFEFGFCKISFTWGWIWPWIWIWILQNIFHLRCEFEIGVEADDADVSWYRYQLSLFPIYSTSVNGDKEYTYCTHVQVITFIWKEDKKDIMGPILMYMLRRSIFDCDHSETARRSTWRTEELRLFPMERRGNLYSRLTRIMLTTMTMCSMPGHPPWQCDNLTM